MLGKFWYGELRDDINNKKKTLSLDFYISVYHVFYAIKYK